MARARPISRGGRWRLVSIILRAESDPDLRMRTWLAASPRAAGTIRATRHVQAPRSMDIQEQAPALGMLRIPPAQDSTSGTH